MKASALRFRRLVVLRAQQHRAAVADVHAARHRLQQAEDACIAAAQGAADARLAAWEGLQRAASDEWLLANADAQCWTLALAALRRQRERAAQAAEQASAGERAARRVSMQMDAVLERIEHELAVQAARAEQQALDEAARMLRNRLGTLAPRELAEPWQLAEPRQPV